MQIMVGTDVGMLLGGFAERVNFVQMINKKSRKHLGNLKAFIYLVMFELFWFYQVREE